MNEGANHVLFKDRQHAGRLLADKLADYHGKSALILGLARGGVVTASEVANHTKIPLDVLVIKKLSGPYEPEFALGAVAPDNVSLVHWSDAHRTGVDEDYMRNSIASASSDIKRKMILYRKKKKPIRLEGKTVILVDDGAATGASMESAVLWARKKKAREIVIAVPIISTEATAKLTPEADALVACHRAGSLRSIGEFYASFPQITDAEVLQLLH